MEKLTTLLKQRYLVAMGLSLLFYFLALVTPALEFDQIRRQGGGGRTWVMGILCLVSGVFSLILGQFGWLANLLLPPAWLLLALQKRVAAGMLGVLALAVAMHTFALFYYPVPSAAYQGDKDELVTLGPGFWLWLLSMVTVIVGAMLPPPPVQSPFARDP